MLNDDHFFNDSIQSMEHATSHYAEYVVVSWNITSLCNYRCPYCSVDLNGGQLPGFPVDIFCNFVNRVIDHYTGSLGKKVYFDITGGEATLYPGLLELLQHIKDRGGYTGLMSNGSFAIQKWQLIAPVLDHLCLTFHPRQSRPGPFLNLAKTIHPVTSTHFNVMMYPPLFDQAMEMAKSLRSILRNSSLNVQPLLESLGPDMPLMKYTPAQQKEMEEFDCSIPWDKDRFSTRGGMKMVDGNGSHVVMEPPQILLSHMNRWKGWTCWAGLEFLAVQADGKVLRAWCKQDLVGNIQTYDWAFPTTPTVCRQDLCQAACDIMTRKTSARYPPP